MGTLNDGYIWIFIREVGVFHGKYESMSERMAMAEQTRILCQIVYFEACETQDAD